jgi:pimeloyl-ACP methyl ester carboxylesterase
LAEVIPIERGLVRISTGYMHYRSAGSGPTIVMLHVSHRSSTMFIDTMTRLSARYRTIAIDLPGFGDSEPLPQQPSISGYARAVEELLLALKIERPVILGMAVGAYIAVEIAQARPDAVAALVLQSCPFYRDREFSSERHAIARSAYRTDSTGFPIPRTMQDVIDRDLIHAPLEPTQEWLDRENTDLVKAGRRFWDAMLSVGTFDLGSALEGVRCPVLLMWGERFIYAETRDQFVKRLRHHEVALVPKAGLFMQIDNPEATDAAVAKFVDRVTSGTWRN